MQLGKARYCASRTRQAQKNEPRTLPPMQQRPSLGG
ncbi:unnamed protein product [Amoebophrya sp. A120]|nr:unnamed protein product [Amoebophrya sp. A120]|eukprot:GSA120T00024562001.1